MECCKVFRGLANQVADTALARIQEDPSPRPTPAAPLLCHRWRGPRGPVHQVAGAQGGRLGGSQVAGTPFEAARGLGTVSRERCQNRFGGTSRIEGPHPVT